MTAIITTVTVATINSTSFHRPTNRSLNIPFDSTVIISVIGDIAVILTFSLLIVCVVIRFKKGQSNTLSTTTASMERPQAINPGILCDLPNFQHRKVNVTVCTCNQNPAYGYFMHFPIPSETLANIQCQEESSQEMPIPNPTYINLDPDHCQPVKNPAYVSLKY